MRGIEQAEERERSMKPKEVEEEKGTSSSDSGGVLRYKLNIGRIGSICREPDRMKTDRLGPDRIKEPDQRIGSTVSERPLEAYAPG